MINLDISQAVFLYVTITLLFIFISWIFLEAKTIHPRFIREKADVWQCAICAYTYVDSKRKEISRCPQCQSFNKKTPQDRYTP